MSADRNQPEPGNVQPTDAIDAKRYRRLRLLGAAPCDSPQLSGGTVLRFQSLDMFVDDDLKAHPSRGEATWQQTPSDLPWATVVELSDDNFRKAWARSGRQYGRPELENVHLGWQMARMAVIGVAKKIEPKPLNLEVTREWLASKLADGLADDIMIGQPPVWCQGCGSTVPDTHLLPCPTVGK